MNSAQQPCDIWLSQNQLFAHHKAIVNDVVVPMAFCYCVTVIAIVVAILVSQLLRQTRHWDLENLARRERRSALAANNERLKALEATRKASLQGVQIGERCLHDLGVRTDKMDTVRTMVQGNDRPLEGVRSEETMRDAQDNPMQDPLDHVGANSADHNETDGK